MSRIVLAILAFALATMPAFGDAIDGLWCSEKGDHVSIEGPKITLAGKTSFEGTYARHEFLYTVPQGEDHAGDQIYMRLRDEEDMTSFTIKDGQHTQPVAWKRCAETS